MLSSRHRSSQVQSHNELADAGIVLERNSSASRIESLSRQ
jgi:hypothetical protein